MKAVSMAKGTIFDGKRGYKVYLRSLSKENSRIIGRKILHLRKNGVE